MLPEIQLSNIQFFVSNYFFWWFLINFEIILTSGAPRGHWTPLPPGMISGVPGCPPGSILTSMFKCLFASANANAPERQVFQNNLFYKKIRNEIEFTGQPRIYRKLVFYCVALRDRPLRTRSMPMDTRSSSTSSTRESKINKLYNDCQTSLGRSSGAVVAPLGSSRMR